MSVELERNFLLHMIWLPCLDLMTMLITIGLGVVYCLIVCMIYMIKFENATYHSNFYHLLIILYVTLDYYRLFILYFTCELNI